MKDLMEWDLDCSKQVDPCLTFEKLCLEQGLVIHMKGSLAKYPGSVHWHLKKRSAKGTLEATYWRGRLWLKIRSNRAGDWVTETVNALQDTFIR